MGGESEMSSSKLISGYLQNEHSKLILGILYMNRQMFYLLMTPMFFCSGSDLQLLVIFRCDNKHISNI